MKSDDLQEIVKGFANHYRIDILRLLEEKPGLDTSEIAGEINADYKTIAAHASRLARSRLVTKKYRGSAVLHTLSNRGKFVLKFLRKLE